MKSICVVALGASAEYEVLKKIVADANEKAAAEHALREKHEARVITAERELQEAVTKSEILEQSLVGKNPNLPKLSKPWKMLGKKPEVLYRTFRMPGRLRLVTPVVFMDVFT